MADGSVIFDTKLDQSGLEKGLSSLGIKLTKGIAAAVTGATAALAAAGKQIVQTGMEFEYTMSSIGALTGATAEEMQLLSDAAVKAGKDTVYSAGESALAIEELVKAGLSTEQILSDGLSGALNLAAAGGIGLANAAEIASIALNSFRDDGLNMTGVANILAGAANASAADVGSLNTALAQCAAVASGVGLSFEDTSTALAVFAQNGLKGSDAGTSLKTMLNNLQPRTDKQAAAFKELGLVMADGTSAFYDANGSLKSMDEIAGLLQTSLESLTDAERNKAMYTMFGSDSMRAANILYKEGAEGIRSMNAEMSKVTAADVAAKKLDNLKGSVEFLKGSVETLGISIYNDFAEPLKGAVDFATEQMDGLLSAYEESGFEGLINAAGEVLGDVANKVVEFAPKVIDAAVGLLTSLMKTLAANAGNIGKAAADIGVSIVSGLVDVLPDVIDGGLKLILGFAQGLNDGLPELIPKATEAITTIISTLGENLPLLIETAAQIVVALVEGIAEALPELIPAAVEAIITIAESLTAPDMLSTILTAALDLIIALADGLVDAIPELVDALPKIIESLVGFLIGAIPDIIQAGIALMSSLLDALPEILAALIPMIPELINGLVDGLISNIGTIAMAGVQLITALVSYLPQIIAEIVAAVPLIIKGLYESVVERKGELAEAGKNLMRGLWEGILDIKDWLLDRIRSIGASITGAVKDLFGISSPSKVFRDVIGKNLMIGLADGISDNASDVLDELDAVASDIKSKDFSLYSDISLSGIDADAVIAHASSAAYTHSAAVSDRAAASASFGPTSPAPSNDAQDGGDTFIFNSPENIDAREARRLFVNEKRKRELEVDL